jgi:hypothetical protein
MELLQQSIRFTTLLVESLNIQKAQLVDLTDLIKKYQQVLEDELQRQKEIK